MLRLRTTLLLPLIAAACGGLTTEPEPIEGEVRVVVREAHGVHFDQSGAPGVGVFLATEQTFPCTNHRLMGQLVRAEAEAGTEAPDTLRVELFGVRPPHSCEPGEAPAAFAAMLPERRGTFVLAIAAEGRTDRYDLRITEERVELEPLGPTAFTRIPYPVFWHYPERSFALLCRVEAPEDRERCAEVEGALAAAEGVAPHHFGEEGAIPYPVPDPDGDEAWTAAYFLYEADSVWNGLPEEVDRLGRLHPGLDFLLLNWRNAVLAPGAG